MVHFLFAEIRKMFLHAVLYAKLHVPVPSLILWRILWCAK